MGSRRRAKRRVRGVLLIIAIAVLIAGFMIRRMMVAGVMRTGAHSAPPAAAPDHAQNSDPEGEHISNADRKRLDEVIRQKTGAH